MLFKTFHTRPKNSIWKFYREEILKNQDFYCWSERIGFVNLKSEEKKVFPLILSWKKFLSKNKKFEVWWYAFFVEIFILFLEKFLRVFSSKKNFYLFQKNLGTLFSKEKSISLRKSPPKCFFDDLSSFWDINSHIPWNTIYSNKYTIFVFRSYSKIFHSFKMPFSITNIRSSIQKLISPLSKIFFDFSFINTKTHIFLILSSIIQYYLPPILLSRTSILQV